MLTEASLLQAREIGIELVFNTPNEKSRPGYLKMGWEAVGRVPLRARPFKPLRSATKLGHFWLGRADTSAVPAPIRNAEDVLSKIDIEPYLVTWRAEQRYHTARTSDYLRWRYASVPHIDYGGAVEGNADTGAAAIYRLRRRGVWVELMLCELLLGNQPQAIAAGSRLLRRLGKESGADYGVGVAAPGTPEGRALTRAGFLTVPGVGPILTVRPLAEDIDLLKLRDWSNWRLAAGDIELF